MHDSGKKVLLSAFGSTFKSTPDMNAFCIDLAKYAIDNNLDGIDLDFENNPAFESELGTNLMIQCTNAIRSYN